MKQGLVQRRGFAVRLLLLLVLLSALIGQASVQAQDESIDPSTPSGEATNIPQPDHFRMETAAVDAELQSVAVKDAKLDSVLGDLADQVLSGAVLAGTDEVLGVKFEGDKVEVIAQIDATNLAMAQQAFAAAGGQVVYTSLDESQIQALVPVAALRTLAGDPAINYLHRPAYAITTGELQAGLTTTEGVAITNANAWHSAGYYGSGVRVAVIDMGFAGYTSLLGTDLPSSVVAVNFASTGDIGGDTAHGTACAEIVHDMAPGASLYLLRVNTDLDLQRAVTYAMQNGIHVISTSLGWYNVSPGDGTGFLANEVARARNAGVLWVTAASNDRENHWGGLFSSPDGNQWHDFALGQEVNCFTSTPGGNCLLLASGYNIRAYLRWDNWTAPINQDYDFQIVRWDGSSWQRVNSGGDDFQNGASGQRPVEAAFAQTSGSSTYYGIAIRRYSATRTNVNFELFAPKFFPMRYTVYARSLSNLADAPGAITVAALDARSPYPQERYSSQGPTNGPGGTLSGGFIKPDVAAFANVNTRSYGTTSSKFNGTSAATPHVAGAAALVRGVFWSYSPALVANYLLVRAIDMGPNGRDPSFGYGRLNLSTPPAITRRFDFNADGRSDIFWRSRATGQMALWRMNGTNPISASSVPTVGDTNWQIVGSGDFNRDGRADLLWRHRLSGSNAIWFMNNQNVLASVAIGAVSDANWQIRAVGDFNGDRYADILWRNRLTGSNAIWFMRGASRIGSAALPRVSDLRWNPIGLGDFNADGRADILWRHSSAGLNSIWFMSGGSLLASVALPTVSDTRWQIRSTGDLSGDRRSDIFWRNTSTGSNVAWLMNSGSIARSLLLPAVTDLRWQVMSDGDYNANGRADVLWRHSTGANVVWFMNGGSVSASMVLPTVGDTRWQTLGMSMTGTGVTLNDSDETLSAPVPATDAEIQAALEALENALLIESDSPELTEPVEMTFDALESQVPEESQPMPGPVATYQIYIPSINR